MMLGIPSGTRPQPVGENGMKPVSIHGLQAMSISLLIDENTPMVWRGPMASGALQQLITQTQWENLDYLLIDMPPGTGDIQLTLSQKVAVDGAVVVTTPQDIALLDAKKGIEMFNKVNIPVLGVVENMSTHICSACGHEEHIFGAGGGQRIARDYDTELLGSLPLTMEICQQADSGTPTVAAEPDSAVSLIYRDVAKKLMAKVQSQADGASKIPQINIVED
jgi:ATP-binding protein involved in chromosome partitioning